MGGNMLGEMFGKCYSETCFSKKYPLGKWRLGEQSEEREKQPSRRPLLTVKIEPCNFVCLQGSTLTANNGP